MSGRRGYTLIEMLVVIAIISILASLVLAAVAAARRHARIQQAELTLRLTCAKITEYETDFHDYPPSEGADAVVGGERLFEALFTKDKNGPYISLKDIQICDENHNGLQEISDPWGHAFRYLHHRNYGRENPNRRSYRLYSIGPDGIEDPYNFESDDLVNWKKGHEGDSEE